MTKSFQAGMITLAAGILVGFASAPTFAQGPTSPHPAHHNSNTLSKLGNAIQYPVRKAGENLSINAHRATGHSSIETNHSTKEKAIIFHNGAKQVIHRGHYRRHHHRHVK